MREFRAYVIDGEGHIALRVDLEVQDEAEARERAKLLVDGRAVELGKAQPGSIDLSRSAGTKAASGHEKPVTGNRGGFLCSRRPSSGRGRFNAWTGRAANPGAGLLHSNRRDIAGCARFLILIQSHVCGR